MKKKLEINKLNLIVNDHECDGKGWGNGGHGHCKHCGIAMVTDLGYCSWSGVKCKDRKPTFDYSLHGAPDELKSYAEFNSLVWNAPKQVFIRPFSDVQYTVLEIADRINALLT